MKRILFCCLLLTGICLSGCTGQINQPDTPPSTSEESGVLPGSESEESTEMPPKETTIPSEESKQVLTLTIDGIAVDVRWEDTLTHAEKREMEKVFSSFQKNIILERKRQMYGIVLQNAMSLLPLWYLG